MPEIGLFYGTETGNTQKAAEDIQAALGEMGDVTVSLFDVADTDVDQMEKYEYLILGAPTLEIGDLNETWLDVFRDFQDLDFSGKTVAVFGLGDAMGYPDTFVDAIALLAEVVQEKGGKLIGAVPASDYDFEDSRALQGDVESGTLMGLALDVDNEEDLSEERTNRWVKQIHQEFGF